jgi:thioredoxin-like negative regulator of GroEL
VLLHFYSDACEPCFKLEKNVFSRPEVVEAIHRNYVPVKIHGTTNAKIAQQYRVDRWPTDVICSIPRVRRLSAPPVRKSPSSTPI